MELNTEARFKQSIEDLHIFIANNRYISEGVRDLLVKAIAREYFPDLFGDNNLLNSLDNNAYTIEVFTNEILDKYDRSKVKK